tara:strand:- start:376 stop:609 length:234 start_codon:yes stop_codon:yes gene_type:complete
MRSDKSIRLLKLLSFLIETQRMQSEKPIYRVKKERYDSNKSVYFKDNDFMDCNNYDFVKAINKAIKTLKREQAKEKK